ncbi:MAG: hypothetical protein Ct9H300mP13_3010 [Gammaproteobacteria bacterium]|nr:MAG: hypothetical protein Ct9H300mP13_3010 [Gammaproteobacteria bacterium]
MAKFCVECVERQTSNHVSANYLVYRTGGRVNVTLAKNPVDLPSGVEVKMSGRNIQVKGPKGELSLDLHPTVNGARGNQLR